MLFEDIAGTKGGRVVVKDSKTTDKKTSYNYKDYILEWDNEDSNIRAVIKDPKGKIIYEYAKGAEPTFAGFQSKVDANISKTTDSLYKGQKVMAIKSEEGLREGETYTVIRGEKPITQSSEAEVKTVYVLQDSSGNLVTVSGCEDLFYKTKDVNPIYSVRKNLRTGTIEYDKGGNWLPIEGKIKEAFENEQYIFSRTDKEGYAHYTVQVMDSTDTFTKGEALKVKIGEIQKNMDAARKMGYDTAQYQKEIDKLATKDNLLTPEMIRQLQQAYNGIERVDPSQPTYTKIITLLDRLSNEQLKQLSNTGIKFISKLARNRVKDVKTKDVSEYRQGQIKGLRGWYSDYKKAKAHGNNKLAAEIMVNIERELSITGIKKSEIVKDREIDAKDMKNQPSTDKTEMTVTLPDGKVQVFRLSDGDRVYLKGSTLYWSLEQWEAAKTKMLAAGAQINEKGLK